MTRQPRATAATANHCCWRPALLQRQPLVAACMPAYGRLASSGVSDTRCCTNARFLHPVHARSFTPSCPRAAPHTAHASTSGCCPPAATPAFCLPLLAAADLAAAGATGYGPWVCSAGLAAGAFPAALVFFPPALAPACSRVAAAVADTGVAACASGVRLCPAAACLCLQLLQVNDTRTSARCSKCHAHQCTLNSAGSAKCRP